MLDKKKVLVLVLGPMRKSDFIKNLCQKSQVHKLKYLNSWTTRKPRYREYRSNYVFVSKEKFEEEINNNNFYESNLREDNYYGVHKNDIKKYFNEYDFIIKDLDITGIKNFLKLYENGELNFRLFIIALIPENDMLIDNYRKHNHETNVEKMKMISEAQEEINMIYKLKRENKVDHLILKKNYEIDNFQTIKKVIGEIIEFLNN